MTDYYEDARISTSMFKEWLQGLSQISLVEIGEDVLEAFEVEGFEHVLDGADAERLRGFIIANYPDNPEDCMQYDLHCQDKYPQMPADEGLPTVEEDNRQTPGLQPPPSRD